ncbi:MAG: NYN domain-containing protein [Anaerolineae bacterium]|nr:NYN domain-containing protein [Anaerolineae bacterium]
MHSSICRIGVFYDGSFFTGAQQYFYINNFGWLHPLPFHGLIEYFVRKQEQSFSNHKVVYASWHQGLFSASQSSEHQMKLERNRHLDLIHAGVEPRYIPMSQSQVEKGVDVALAVNAMEVGLDGKIDIAVLVTGDGDFVPLARTLMKHGLRVAAVYFEYEHHHKGKDYQAFINKRLLDTCNYTLNINTLEKDREYKVLFNGLFRQAEQFRDTSPNN